MPTTTHNIATADIEFEQAEAQWRQATARLQDVLVRRISACVHDVYPGATTLKVTGEYSEDHQVTATIGAAFDPEGHMLGDRFADLTDPIERDVRFLAQISGDDLLGDSDLYLVPAV